MAPTWAVPGLFSCRSDHFVPNAKIQKFYKMAILSEGSRQLHFHILTRTRIGLKVLFLELCDFFRKTINFQEEHIFWFFE